MPRGLSQHTNVIIESDINYRAMYNMDTFRDMFRLKTFVEYADSSVKSSDVVFLDFNDLFLDTHKLFLASRCEIKEFQSRWQYRPNYLSYDIYGTQSFAYLLLYMNDVVSVLDFTFDYVKVPMMSAIKELIISNQRLFPDRSVVKDVQFG